MNRELSASATLSHYRLVSKIGAGGMGDVYLAEDTKLDRLVALKILPQEFTADAERMRRFLLEAKSASALNHPNIITIYETGETEDTNFIATEYIEGRTLNNCDPLSLTAVLDVATQIASALQAAHNAGIIHRDIKPENVMIRPDGLVKILDFGIAKLSGPLLRGDCRKETDPEAATALKAGTGAGIIIGTASYMSPEQARGKAIDARSDIFSFGVVLYEMLSRRKPFVGVNPMDVIGSIIADEHEPLTHILPEVPPELDRIISKALQKSPERRYQTASELLIDLKSLQKRLEFEAELKRSSVGSRTTEAQTQLITTEPEPPNSIAVLPFVNMSRDEDVEYFCDGLAEELLNLLAKIRGLRVAARTSAFSFKGTQTTIFEIGRILKVASVLEGSLRMAGNRVRISVQLVNVGDGYQLWSETYDRTMDDIFEVQDDIAQSVVRELRTRLMGEEAGTDASGEVRSEVAKAARGRAANPEAQRLMLLGRYFLDRTTREDTSKAIVYFREALNVDPAFALCWAELGRAYSIQAGRAWIPVKEGFDRSRDAVNRALSLEPDLAEGHAQLGRIQVTYDWDLHAAEVSYRKALDLAPGSSSVLDGAAMLAYKLGRLQEALDLVRRVLVQDPLSAAFWHNLGLISHAAGLLAESESAFRRALELVPQRSVSRALLALVLMDEARFDEALEQAMAEPYEAWRLWAQTIVYYSAGRYAESDESLRILIEQHAEGNAYQIAEAHSMRGEVDRAFDWLARAVEERDSGLTHAKVNLRFRTLRDDRRWEPFLKKLGFDV